VPQSSVPPSAPPSSVAVVSVSLPASAKVVVGATVTLRAVVSPAGATDQAVRWASSDAKIAAVSASGVVTGRAVGSARVTATAGGKSATTVVSVTAAHVAKVSLGAARTVRVGGTVALKAVVAPSVAANKKLKWRSGNSHLASVTQSGVVTGWAAGRVRIYATSVDGGKTGSVVVTVKAVADSRCAWTGAARAVRIGIGAQRAWFCSRGRLVRVSAVTTGASAHGDGTPTGTFRVVWKVRNTVLYPSTGGAYPVKYWMAFIGNMYGIHDSPWQSFPYGSQLYKTRGSHGCVHVPGYVMAWLFSWAPVGTPIRITA